MGRTLAVVMMVLIAAVGTASAKRPPPPEPVPVPVPSSGGWDSRGWQLLGEQQVSGRVDRDRIQVGRYEGQFSKLTVVVLDSELEMLNFTVNFGDGTRYEPKLRHIFRENQRTRAIDLPPSARVINHIELTYRNLPGGGRARVQVWGWKTGDNRPMPPPVVTGPAPLPPPAAPVWDSRGWQMLGEQQVSGRVDRDRIQVGRYEGQFSKLTVVVLDSELEMLNFTVNFGDGTRYEPKLQHIFRENQRTRAIDLPPSARVINHIDLTYRNLPGGGRARVQVWGWKSGDNRPMPRQDEGRPARPGEPTGGLFGHGWDSRGWTMLGEQKVSGRVDRDRIRVGRDEGKFRKLMIVVLDSDLELLEFDVKFARGPSWRPAVKHYFRENSRTREIDLPGSRRVIKTIDLKYRNLPGGGAARVQVWGK